MREKEKQRAKGREKKCLNGDWRPMRCKKMFFLLAMGFLFFCSTRALALYSTFEVAAGYDDNAAEVTEGEGSGVVQYRIQLDQSLSKDQAGPDLILFLDAAYSQYFDFDNNFQVRAGTELSSAPWRDRFTAGVFTEVVAYRDDLVAEDEYNTLLVGGSLQWLADARLTLSLQQTFSRVDYQNPVSLPGQRVYAVGSGRGRGAGGRQMIEEDEWITYAREDTIWSTEGMASYAMSPDVQVDISFLYRDADSSDDYESYQELGGYAKLAWFCSESLDVFASGYVSKLDYEAAPDITERRDDFYGVRLGGNWWVGNMKLFVQYDRTENDSPISGEDYKKTVTLCGVSYTF